MRPPSRTGCISTFTHSFGQRAAPYLAHDEMTGTNIPLDGVQTHLEPLINRSHSGDLDIPFTIRNKKRRTVTTLEMDIRSRPFSTHSQEVLDIRWIDNVYTCGRPRLRRSGAPMENALGGPRVKALVIPRAPAMAMP
jgi:hypothetical protein